MVEAGVIAIFIPIAFFAMIAIMTWSVMHFRTERRKAELSGGGEYRQLAEEAVRGQRQLLDEIQRMNATLKEIERLLREV